MKYDVELSVTALAGLSGLDSGPARRVCDKIDWLAENADVVSHEAMTGQYRGMYRLRIGVYRAVYSLDRETRTLTFDVIGHRRYVYD